MRLAGIDPPSEIVNLGEVIDDGKASEGWVRAMKLNAERRRN